MNRNVSGRQATISFERGLFVLRYASCDVPQSPPRVRFAVAGGLQSGIRIVPVPGSAAGELNGVGELAVISAEVPGAIDVLIEESRSGGGIGCSLALDRLGGSAQAQPSQPSVAMTAGPVPGSARAAHLIAHLSNRGDVALALGDWIGGPQAPTPIEGLSIPAALVDDEPFEYQVMSAGSDRWSGWLPAGSFAGSRGQARALRGIRLRLTAAGSHVLRAEALFLGAPIDQKVGRDLEFMSSSPFDVMVGFRIELVRDAARDVAPVSLAAVPASVNRLKVFRSSRAS